MPTPSTIIPSSSTLPLTPRGWLDLMAHNHRPWRVLIILLIGAFVLSGCHARGGGHIHASSCESSSGDSALAVFYVVYLLGWIIVSAADG